MTLDNTDEDRGHVVVRRWCRRRGQAAILFSVLLSMLVTTIMVDRGILQVFIPSKNVVKESNHDRDLSAVTALMEHIMATDTQAGIQAIQSYKQLKGNVPDHELDMIASFASNYSSLEGWPWSDFDWGNKFPPPCGMNKSFWPSLSNTSVGYLMARGQKNYDAMTETFKLEQYLVHKFGIQQVTVVAPTIIPNVSSTMDDLLQAYTEYQKLNHKAPIILQKVRKVPQPNLFIGSTEYKSMGVRKGIPTFAKQLEGHDMGAFKKKYKEETQRLAAFLDDRKDLLSDFQLMLTTDGTFYHVDLDRGKRWWQTFENGTIISSHYNYTHSSKAAAYMETMERILYWLTEANGNYSGLHDEKLFRRPYIAEWENETLNEFIAEPITAAEHDCILATSMLKYFEDVDDLSRIQSEMKGALQKAVVEGGESPSC